MYSKKYYQKAEFGFTTADREDHRRILELINFKDQTILEIGCGLGTLLKLIPLSAKYKFGTESNQFAVNHCRSSGLNVVLHSRTDKLPFPSSKFNVVIMNEVIEHLADPTMSMLEIYRVMKPKGKLIITTPNKNWLVSNLDKTHLSEMTYRQLEDLVRRTKFSILKHEVSGFSPYNFLGRKIIFPLGRRLIKFGHFTSGVSEIRNRVDHSRLDHFRKDFLWLGTQQLILATKK